MEVDELWQKIAELEAENLALKTQLARAKDAAPVERPSFQRVKRLVENACMWIERSGRGWLIKMGKLRRWFKSLKEIWEILTVENWYLADIFPPNCLVYSPPPKKAAKPKIKLRNPDLTAIDINSFLKGDPWMKDQMSYRHQNSS